MSQQTGYSEPVRRSFTGIVTLCRTITGVNLSVGDRHEHTPSEYLSISDDTQLAFWTLEVILEHRGLDLEALAKAFAWDNDTIAACVGAAVGALHGASSLPERWKSGLIGRTRHDDDGHVFELLDQAKNGLMKRGALTN